MSRNRLTDETSPYLLQHKDNPVHWWAWGSEAMEEAKRTGKPILLSVGYAACHWCHVMAHESFEADDVAAVMNELFVNVKVDREERPDIDAIYMSALHSLGEHGGWPLTMFLTPDAEPFWGGTYFPKEPKFGRPGFVHVLEQVAKVYREEPEKAQQNADAIKANLTPRRDGVAEPLTEAHLADAAKRLVSAIDQTRGGLKGAPKFPQTNFLSFLWKAGLRYGLTNCLDAVDLTLRHISQGGIYDHLSGGFARYSVDERWLIPHFEKMLYDNGLLLDLMTEVWRERQSPLLAIRIAETADWALREMVAEGGGFAASYDADSDGEEGKFCVWTPQEIADVLGAEDANYFCQIYDITPGGNFEGKNNPNRLQTMDLLPAEDEQRLAAMRVKLLAKRQTRIQPGWDDKVLADWNGLMIAALAKAGDIFSRAEWLGAAERAFAFVTASMTNDGRLLHAYRAGVAKAPATASDYANMITAAIRLHGVTGSIDYLDWARRWTEILNRHYWSSELGGYHFTADDTDDVIIRTLGAHDDATPNANGVMVTNLVALWTLTGDESYRQRGEAILTAFSADLTRNLVAHTGLLAATLDMIVPHHVVVIASEATEGGRALRQALRTISLPDAVVQVVSDSRDISQSSPASGKQAINDAATAYVCIGTQCTPPVTDSEAFVDTVRSLREVTVA